jgi:transcriptional regulator with XRE-family HTH domain
MRSALAVRDVAAVFRLLQKHGVSQRQIAALTGQSQSEISEILGGRRVVSYDLLVRIAELCRTRHRSAYAERWIMPTRVVRGLVDDAAATKLVGICRP